MTLEDIDTRGTITGRCVVLNFHGYGSDREEYVPLNIGALINCKLLFTSVNTRVGLNSAVSEDIVHYRLLEVYSPVPAN